MSRDRPGKSGFPRSRSAGLPRSIWYFAASARRWDLPDPASPCSNADDAFVSCMARPPAASATASRAFLNRNRLDRALPRASVPLPVPEPLPSSTNSTSCCDRRSETETSSEISDQGRRSTGPARTTPSSSANRLSVRPMTSTGTRAAASRVSLSRLFVRLCRASSSESASLAARSETSGARAKARRSWRTGSETAVSGE